MSLAFLPLLLTAAAAGFAAIAAVPAAAGQAGLAAVLQRWAGVSPLQPVVLQQLRLKHRQVFLATSDLCSEQHDVGPIPCFLQSAGKKVKFRTVNNHILILESSSPQSPNTHLAGDILPARVLSPCGQVDMSAAQPVQWRQL